MRSFKVKVTIFFILISALLSAVTVMPASAQEGEPAACGLEVVVTGNHAVFTVYTYDGRGTWLEDVDGATPFHPDITNDIGARNIPIGEGIGTTEADYPTGPNDVYYIAGVVSGPYRCQVTVLIKGIGNGGGDGDGGNGGGNGNGNNGQPLQSRPQTPAVQGSMTWQCDTLTGTRDAGIPNRMKYTLKTKGPLRTGSTFTVTIDGKSLVQPVLEDSDTFTFVYDQPEDSLNADWHYYLVITPDLVGDYVPCITAYVPGDAIKVVASNYGPSSIEVPNLED